MIVEVTHAFFVEQIRDVGKYNLPWLIATEIPGNDIGRYMACFHCFCHPSIRIFTSDRSREIDFFHEPIDFLQVHDDGRILMKKPHIDLSASLWISSVMICVSDEGEIPLVSLFSFNS